MVYCVSPDDYDGVEVILEQSINKSFWLLQTEICALQ